MSHENPIVTCEHCGNKVPMQVKGGYREDGEIIFDWQFVRCPVCHQPSLIETNSEDCSADGSTFVNVLYPTPIAPPWTDIPARIGNAYRKALRLRHIDANAFAVAIGRTLDMICQDRKAKGRDLNEKIDSLGKSGLPNRLVEIAHQLRLIRNLGAHTSEVEVAEEDVPVLIAFTDSILDYLYVAPAKLEELRDNITRRQERKLRRQALFSDDE